MLRVRFNRRVARPGRLPDETIIPVDLVVRGGHVKFTSPRFPIRRRSRAPTSVRLPTTANHVGRVQSRRLDSRQSRAADVAAALGASGG